MSQVACLENRIAHLLDAAEGAYSIRTIKGYGADLKIFADWCLARKEDWCPANSKAVATFVDEQVERHCISTIRRRLCAIAFAHRMHDLQIPNDANIVRLAVRRATRRCVSRPQQKLGLTHAIRSTVVAACPETVAGARDAALISVGYDTFCRSSELAAMRVEHIQLGRDGDSSILIPRSKADTSGDGRIAHFSPDTSRLLSDWIDVAHLTNGPVFRSLHLHRVADGPLATSSIRRLIKRATQRAGLDSAITAELSGHSMRIGAAQDMMVAGFDAIAIMQAGGWKSANVVLRYVENAETRKLHERRWDRLQQPR
jgi:integrase/recombinase XerD